MIIQVKDTGTAKTVFKTMIQVLTTAARLSQPFWATNIDKPNIVPAFTAHKRLITVEELRRNRKENSQMLEITKRIF